MDFRLFIPITKIDARQRLVFGTIAEEVPDKAGEIMDYETAKPMFEAWSHDVQKASNGKSVGNLRAMHGSVAAGKLDQIVFDDSARRIDTVAKVVDDSEWNKVLEGVYTGFSVGGRYLRRWRDAVHPELTRYTPEPMEVSLVDNPCIPSATFEVIKTDGSRELRKFRGSPTNRDADVVQGWQAKDGSFHLTKSAALKRNAESSEHETDISRDALEFADPGYQADGMKRYPIDTEAHIRAAWGYIHHDKNQAPYTADEVDKIKAKIVAAWKHKIDPDGPPLANAPAEYEQDDDVAAGDDDNAVDTGDANNAGNAANDYSQEMATKILAISANHDGLAKALAQLGPRIDLAHTRMNDLAKRLEHLESQPMPGGPATRLVSKAEDAGTSEEGDPLTKFQRHLETLTPEQRAHALTKIALKNPIRM